MASQGSGGDRGHIQNVGGTIRRVPLGQGVSPGAIRAGPPPIRIEGQPGLAAPASTVQILAPDRPRTGISWAPLAEPHRLSFMGTSFPAVRAALEKALGPFPCRIGWQFEGPILAGMAAAAGEGSAPYDEIYAALKQHGELELRLES